VVVPSHSPLQSAAERIIARFLKRGSTADVQIVSGFRVHAERGVDITVVESSGARRAIKVKADPYYGTDAVKIRDRSLPFYRAQTRMLAFESVANAATKEPGWMLGSEADEIYYYYLAVAQEEEEVAALLQERDEVFFPELKVERDELLVLPMTATRVWFERNAEQYTPRPVLMGSTSAWYRLVPREVVQREVPGVKVMGPVFASLLL
jgi:hypothetical protein